jgi:hypothetical protein
VLMPMPQRSERGERDRGQPSDSEGTVTFSDIPDGDILLPLEAPRPAGTLEVKRWLRLHSPLPRSQRAQPGTVEATS